MTSSGGQRHTAAVYLACDCRKMKTVRERECALTRTHTTLNEVESEVAKEEKSKSKVAHINQTHKTRNYYDHPVTYYCRPINTHHNDNKMEKRMRKNE